MPIFSSLVCQRPSRGHCIGVDPYYLTHRAELAGYQPQVILAGRRVNDQMGRVDCTTMPEVSAQGRRGQDGGSSRNHLQGNVPDIRNSKVIDIVMELRSFGADVHVADPLANPGECEQAY